MSHNNIDDGWDLYTKTDTGADRPGDHRGLPRPTTTAPSPTAPQNANGDRNGFKLGGDDIAVNHVVRRSIAFHNGKHGFTYNSNPGTMAISNNLSIDNAERNFSFDAGTSVFRNNTSCRFSVQRLQRQDRRQRRRLQPVLDRRERLPVRLLPRRPGLVLRLGRPPRGDAGGQAGDAVTDAADGRRVDGPSDDR